MHSKEIQCYPNWLARQFVVLLLMLVFMSLLQGCAFRRATITAAYVSSVSQPNGRIESDIWKTADFTNVTLRPTLARENPMKRAQVRAIHDGRAISFLISWPDSSECDAPRSWVWNQNKSQYELMENPADEIMMLWALPSPGEKVARRHDLAPLEPRPAAYDMWHWIAKWTEAAQIADDGQFIVQVHPRGANPAEVKNRLYPAIGGDGLIEWKLELDAGRQAVQPSLQPRGYQQFRMPGMVGQAPTGSVGDVSGWGVFNRARVARPKYWVVDENKRTPGYWFETDTKIFRQGFYFIEFYRLLDTGDKQADYQILGRGPHYFTIAVKDDESGDELYVSPPIALRLAPLPAVN